MLDFSAADIILNEAASAKDYRQFQTIVNNIKMSVSSEVKLYLGEEQDPFSLEYIEKIKQIHRMIITTGKRTKYSFSCEGLSDIRTDGETLWRYPGDYREAHRYFIAPGLFIELSKVKSGMKVMEPGSGEGWLTECLVRMGCEVDAIDPCNAFCLLNKTRIERFTAGEGKANIICDDIEHFLENNFQKYDAVFFMASFHHMMNHYAILKHIIQYNLKENGRVILGAEPIIKDSDHTALENILPYPWGPRFDGESLFQMRKRGWLELGYRESYIADMCRKLGLKATEKRISGQSWAQAYVLEKSHMTPTGDIRRSRDELNQDCIALWMKYLTDGKSTDMLFNAYGFRRIVLYGYGKIGKLVYNALKGSAIQIVAVIDRNAQGDDNITQPIIKGYDTSISNFDAVIVTALYDFYEIADNLQKNTDKPIYSFYDIVLQSDVRTLHV